MLNANAESAPSHLGNEVLENVDEYEYLGQVVSQDTNS